MIAGSNGILLQGKYLEHRESIPFYGFVQVRKKQKKRSVDSLSKALSLFSLALGSYAARAMAANDERFGTDC